MITNTQYRVLVFLFIILVIGSAVFSVYNYYNTEKTKEYCKDIQKDAQELKTLETLRLQEYKNMTLAYYGCIEADKKVEAKLQSLEDSKKLADLELSKEAFGYGGIYYEPDFYCVWVREMTMDEVTYAENHELCHVYISKDRTHFCGEPVTIDIGELLRQR